MAIKIETMLGQIDASEVGTINAHDHILTHPPYSRMKIDTDYEMPSKEAAVKELKMFAAAGGNTLIDCTALDYGRDAKGMIEIAKQVPEVNICAITGFNRGDYADWVLEGTAEQFAELMIHDIEVGMDGTEAKAAAIKFGTNNFYIIPSEYAAIKATGVAHRKTGKPVITHTTVGTMGLEQLELLEKEQVDPKDVALSHLDRNLDFLYLSDIAHRGAYIVFDGISKVKYTPDSAKIDMLKRLCDAGFENNIIIAGDNGRKSYLKAYGGGPGFEYLLLKIMPRLLREGFTQQVVDKLFKSNPTRWISRS